MSDTKRASGAVYPWLVRTPPTVVRKFREKRQGRTYIYEEMSTGTIRRAESDREVRKVLGLSPRQYRKARRAERQGAAS